MQFALRVWDGTVPGKDEPWNAFLLWRYLCHRADTCKPTSVFSCISALAHLGIKCGFVLPSTKYDGNPLMYRQIKNMKREISLMYNAKVGADGATFDVKQSTPICNPTVSLLLSALRVYGEQFFLQLNRSNRHNVAASMMQHTCGMRFGHFLSRAYRTTSFVRDSSGSFRLMTDWHRYSGVRSYCLEFELSPRWACLRYPVYDERGNIWVTLTAAVVMQWHFGQLRRAGESLIFAPVEGATPSRLQRKQWLQRSLFAALPLDEGDARRVGQLVSPHAFRAGLTSDLLQAGVAPQTIAIWCRWRLMRAMRMYASRQELSAYRHSSAFRLITSDSR